MISSEQATRKMPLHGIFTAIPPRYDLINHVITWGMDWRWRRLAARECIAWRPKKVLDLCCGTGDLAIDIAHLSGLDAEITGIDFSQPMLEIAAQKAKKSGTDKMVSFRCGDAGGLPFPDNYFDCTGISFAFRNLTYKNTLSKLYLAEIRRVLRPEGRFVIVETSQPRSGVIRKLFHLYLRYFVFWAGYLLSGNRSAYRYLAESTVKYYAPGELRQLLESAGFRKIGFKPLFFGAVAIHTAVK